MLFINTVWADAVYGNISARIWEKRIIISGNGYFEQDISMSLLTDPVEIVPGMWLLPGFASGEFLQPEIERIIDAAPLRHMQTQRGHSMSVGMTNCGEVGWTSDRRGYRYSPTDPLSEKPWPAMPEGLKILATTAAEAAGFAEFHPDACLINQYKPGAQMGAHQDRNERDFGQPIVSVSLGIVARFFVLGDEKRGASTSVDLHDGDVIVFGGLARRYFHGVRKLKESTHPRCGDIRWNLTFRVAQ